jgi:acetoin utilization deacetylase AcuC-like enzyme
MPGTRDERGAEGFLSDTALPKSAILEGFDRLGAERRLFGAELNPDVIKKSGKGSLFLIAPTPSRKRSLALWASLFRNRIAPHDFFRAVAVRIEEFEHRENMLLFGKGRVLYDTRIYRGDEPVGEMTLDFHAVYDRRLGLLAYLKGKRLRIVYIQGISLREQSTGYASALFRYYEGLFHDLGFNEFRLKASLSVGKYYWAKEGFDCLDRSDIRKFQEGLRAFVRRRGLPVGETEVNRLNHAYDIARFRKDLMVPVYRNAQGYYSLEKDERHDDEVRFPLGKAFLLCADPWDGYKVVYTDTPRRTGFVYSGDYLGHKTRSGHAESPKRLARLLDAIHRNDLRNSLVFLDPYLPEMASIERVHDPAYIERFRTIVAQGKNFFATRDYSICSESFDVALLAAGGVMAGVDAVLNRRVENSFCAVRPPGHHAGKRSAMGFCFLNNIAVGAAYARAAYAVERIFILDWDVHHGNGTQEIFEEDPLTYFCSIHEHPSFCYPGTGRRMERGRGRGFGTTLNVPLPPRTGDKELIAAFEREVMPEIERFRPDLIMISAGFDAHREDPIAGLALTEVSYAHMTRRICEAADRHCGGRIVSVLEGGYDGPSLVSSAVAHIKILQGRTETCSSAVG